MSQRDKMMKEPPYAAIHRLVEYVGKTTSDDCDECERRLGPVGNRDHIFHSAIEVQTWLDALEMTPWAQEQMDRLDERY
jgi:hypothetical protein